MTITKTIRREDALYISASEPVLMCITHSDAVVVEVLIAGPDDMRVKVVEAEQVDDRSAPTVASLPIAQKG